MAAFLVAGLLVVAAGLVAWLTWRTKRRTVSVWMVPRGSKVAHAFDRAELTTLPEATALQWCGTWPAAELETNGLAERCRLCQRAVDERERGSL